MAATPAFFRHYCHRSGDTAAPLALSDLPGAGVAPGAARRTAVGLREILHAAAVQRKLASYLDPVSNDLIATSVFLAVNPDVCEADGHRHRHCPHTPAAAAAKVTFYDAIADSSASRSSSSDFSSSDSLSSSTTSSSSSLSAASGPSALPSEEGEEGAGDADAAAMAAQQQQQPSTDARRHQRLAELKRVNPYSRPHTSPLRADALPNIDELRALPRYAQTTRLHNAAIAAGRDCYRSLRNGTIVFCRPFLAQVPCCGQGCRHCPHGHQPLAFIADIESLAVPGPPPAGAAAAASAPATAAEEGAGLAHISIMSGATDSESAIPKPPRRGMPAFNSTETLPPMGSNSSRYRRPSAGDMLSGVGSGGGAARRHASAAALQSSDDNATDNSDASSAASHDLTLE